MTLDAPVEQAFAIGAQRQQVDFLDGTHIVLHPVFDHQTPCLYHRAIYLPSGPVIVDLRRLVRGIGGELAIAPARDVAGTVKYSLRHNYSTAELLLRAALTEGKAVSP